MLSLKLFLQERGVVVSQQRKDDLINLCQRADELGIEIDPDEVKFVTLLDLRKFVSSSLFCVGFRKL